MYSLNVQLLGYELSLEPSYDKDSLNPTLEPSSAAGDAPTPSSSSAPPNGGKGQMLTKALVFKVETIRRAGVHIPPIEWQPDVPSQR